MSMLLPSIVNCLLLFRTRCLRNNFIWSSSRHFSSSNRQSKEHTTQNELHCSQLVPDMASNLLVAEMRYQFWKETLDRIFARKPPRQPVAEELCAAVESHSLSRKWLRCLIDLRRSALDNKCFANVPELESYCKGTTATVLFLVLEISGIRDVHADHVASHIGIAQGIVSHVRSIPYFARKHQVLVPQDLLLLHSVAQEDILRGKKNENVRNLVYDLAGQANVHLERARKHKNELSRKTFPVFLVSGSVERYLNRLRRWNFDVFDSHLQQEDGLLPASLLCRKLCSII